MARLIALSDRMGIERLVIYMGDKSVVEPSPDELRRQNDQVLQVLSHWLVPNGYCSARMHHFSTPSRHD